MVNWSYIMQPHFAKGFLCQFKATQAIIKGVPLMRVAQSHRVRAEEYRSRHTAGPIECKGVHGIQYAIFHRVKELKFTGQVLPENKLVRYTIDIKRVIARRLVMASSDGRMEVDNELIYTAEDMRVGLFND